MTWILVFSLVWLAYTLTGLDFTWDKGLIICLLVWLIREGRRKQK